MKKFLRYLLYGACLLESHNLFGVRAAQQQDLKQGLKKQKKDLKDKKEVTKLLQ